MYMQHTGVAFGSEYLYQSVLPFGLLLSGLDGGQHPHPPPRLAFTRLVREGLARCTFFCVEQGFLPSSVFCGRHWRILLSLHNSVQGMMTGGKPSVKVKCTNLCNNFFYGAKVQDEAQGRAPERDAPKDHRSRRGAAPDRGPGADHRERRSREGRRAEAHLLRSLPRAQGSLPSLYGPLPGAEPLAGASILGRCCRRRRAS